MICQGYCLPSVELGAGHARGVGCGFQSFEKAVSFTSESRWVGIPCRDASHRGDCVGDFEMVDVV